MTLEPCQIIGLIMVSLTIGIFIGELKYKKEGER